MPGRPAWNWRGRSQRNAGVSNDLARAAGTGGSGSCVGKRACGCARLSETDDAAVVAVQAREYGVGVRKESEARTRAFGARQVLVELSARDAAGAVLVQLVKHAAERRDLQGAGRSQSALTSDAPGARVAFIDEDVWA